MKEKLSKEQWVYVLIQNPGGAEQIIGQHDEQSDISFIPAFLEKEDGLKCYHLLKREGGLKDEFQAILLEDLAKQAQENSFLIFLFNGEGEIINKIDPSDLAK